MHVNRKWFFSFLSGIFPQMFGQIVSIIRKILRNTNLAASIYFKMKKTSLPVDMRCSKTSLLKRSIFYWNSTGDPLAKTILGCLDLLEGLSRCLDKEYKYGSCKCWKHIAERFGIEEQEYQKFNCSQVHSPTEVMFEYLKAQNPEITIGDVKDGLHSIAREDVVRVLVKYEQSE